MDQMSNMEEKKGQTIESVAEPAPAFACKG